MRQFTTPEQTAKLIELGVEKPKSIEKVVYTEQYGCGFETAYSIGELIEWLVPWGLSVSFEHPKCVAITIGSVASGVHIYHSDNEFIDALYGMIVKLKWENV